MCQFPIHAQFESVISQHAKTWKICFDRKVTLWNRCQQRIVLLVNGWVVWTCDNFIFTVSLFIFTLVRKLNWTYRCSRHWCWHFVVSNGECQENKTIWCHGGNWIKTAEVARDIPCTIQDLFFPPQYSVCIFSYFHMKSNLDYSRPVLTQSLQPELPLNTASSGLSGYHSLVVKGTTLLAFLIAVTACIQI